jgi:hypothetical protein
VPAGPAVAAAVAPVVVAFRHGRRHNGDKNIF